MTNHTTITVRFITQHPQQGNPGTADIQDVFIPHTHPDHDKIVAFVNDATWTVDHTDFDSIGVDIDSFDFQHRFDVQV